MSSERSPYVVFGYGSLIFKVDCPSPSFVGAFYSNMLYISLLRMSSEKVSSMAMNVHHNRRNLLSCTGPGFLKGYVRRFAQKSHDHRGTPEVWVTALHLPRVSDQLTKSLFTEPW